MLRVDTRFYPGIHHADHLARPSRAHDRSCDAGVQAAIAAAAVAIAAISRESTTAFSGATLAAFPPVASLSSSATAGVSLTSQFAQPAPAAAGLPASRRASPMAAQPAGGAWHGLLARAGTGADRRR